MNGPPVWLGSVSLHRKSGVLVPTGQWGHGTQRQAIKVAHRLLGPVGDPRKERGFLMNATLCFHRMATDAEIERIPPGPGGLAGPPFDEVIWETPDCPPAGLSFTKCDNRTFRTIHARGRPAHPLDRGNKPLITPVDDCGNCPSCHARTNAMNPNHQTENGSPS